MVEVIQTAPAFERLRASDAAESVIVDLVAEAVPTVETPAEVTLGAPASWSTRRTRSW